tara:strand:+ start:122 stop:457 length:336 start_codon:yes stop_codon:yes gene_type:complete
MLIKEIIKELKMEVLNLEKVKEFGITADLVRELVEDYLPDAQNDGIFDEWMIELAQDVAYKMGAANVDLCDAYYDTYPTKEVEEYMTEGQTLKQAIVSYFEDKINYVNDFA